MDYTDLLMEADACSLITKEKPLRGNDGRIKGNRIAIRSDLTLIQKKCVIAEELGHYHTTVSDIIDQDSVSNRKQEYQARLWAYNKVIGLSGIVSAFKVGCRTLYEIADYLDVDESVLNDALSCYRQKYGICTQIDNYVIYFEPSIGVFELIQNT